MAKNGTRKQPSGLTALEKVAREAFGVAFKLREAEANTRLSATAFAKAAREIAECTDKQLDALQSKIETRPELAIVGSFVRRMVQEFRHGPGEGAGYFPEPPRDCSRMIRVFGRPEIEGALAQAGATSALVVALAARTVTAKYSDSFGRWQSVAERDGEIARLRKTREALIGEMREALSGADLVIDYDGVLPAEKARGLAKVSLKMTQGHVTMTPDWPAKLLDFMGSTPHQIRRAA